MSAAIPMPLTEPEVARALEIARALSRAGVPLFLATPNPHSKAGFDLPLGWESTPVSVGVPDRWRPGMALCAVGGHVLDVLDVDPRNGGLASSEALWQAGQWPVTYGTAFTPSGGSHSLIQPLGQGKGELVPGVDLQGGRPDGTGRGFVFIAPTVRASKVDGVARPYRWDQEPDLERLVQWRGEASGKHLAAIAAAWPVNQRDNHSHAGVPVKTAADLLLADQHTTISADRTITNMAESVTAAARQGWGAQFRSALNRAAFAIGAYVGSGYITEGQVIDVLAAAIRLAGFEPDDNDYRWIEQGVADGARHPIVVVRPAPGPFAAETSHEGGFGAKLIDAADLDSVPDPEAMVDGWLYAGTTARMVGQPGAYKSFVALDLALRLALGRDWHGLPVRQTSVLYVVGEGLAGYKKRVAAWLLHNDVSRSELRGKLMITRGSVQIGGEDWSSLERWVLDNECRLIVVDTVARATVGLDENSAKEQGVITECCRSLCELTGSTMLLVHHTGHANGEAGERGRGSSSWRGAVDAEWILTKTGDLTAALRNDRQKDVESGQTVSVRMAKVAGSLVVDINHDVLVESTKGGKEKASKFADDERALKAVLDLLNEDRVPDVRSIVARAGMRHSKVREALDRLIDIGKLIKLASPSGRGEAYRTNTDYSGSKSNGVMDHENPEASGRVLT